MVMPHAGPRGFTLIARGGHTAASGHTKPVCSAVTVDCRIWILGNFVGRRTETDSKDFYTVFVNREQHQAPMDSATCLFGFYCR